MTKIKKKIGLTKAVALLLAMEILVFLIGYAFGFIIGASSGGLQEGFRLASGVLYSWVAFALLGIIGWSICIAALVFKSQNNAVEEQK